MKAHIVKAHEKLNVGDVLEVNAAEFAALAEQGLAISASEHEANERVKAQEARIKAAGKKQIQDAIVRAKDRGAIPVKDTDRETAMLARFENGDSAETLVELINASSPTQTANVGVVTARQTNGSGVETVYGAEPSGHELVKAVIHACEPFAKSERSGGLIGMAKNDSAKITAAMGLAREKTRLINRLAGQIDEGFVVRAANYVDPASNNPLGLLNTELMILKNLGHLENQLPMLDDISTDIAGQPVAFNQQVRSRYFTVPKVQLKTSSNAWDGGTGAGVDINVLLDTHAGVPIEINNHLLASTPRDLFKEQYDPQLYGLGEYITYKLVNTIVNGNTRIANDGSTTSTIKFCNGGTGQPAAFSVAGATLKTFVADLPEAMDESKFPGGDELPNATNLMRFAWVHGQVYAAAASDTNFLLNQSIWGARNAGSNGNVIETGRFNRLGNLKFRKSQLITDQCTVGGSGADAGDNGISVSPGTFSAATTVGFAGTKSALLFVSRVPLDYTKVLPGLPSTAAVEVVTSPTLGVSFLVVKFLDHSYETANVRVQLMFGFGIGDERQGILLNK